MPAPTPAQKTIASSAASGMRPRAAMPSTQKQSRPAPIGMRPISTLRRERRPASHAPTAMPMAAKKKRNCAASEESPISSTPKATRSICRNEAMSEKSPVPAIARSSSRSRRTHPVVRQSRRTNSRSGCRFGFAGGRRHTRVEVSTPATATATHSSCTAVYAPRSGTPAPLRSRSAASGATADPAMIAR